jgi:hypothetical protein
LQRTRIECLLMCVSFTEVIEPSVTHKRVDVKEKIQEPAEHHGVTTESAMPVEEFENKLNGQK